MKFNKMEKDNAKMEKYLINLIPIGFIYTQLPTQSERYSIGKK